MQKKLEKLPGLSNVSGKYTQKRSTDTFSQCSVTHRSGTLSPSSSAYFASALPVPDKNISATAGHAETQRRALVVPVGVSGSVGLIKSTLSRVPNRLSSHALISPAQHSTTVTSPSWPSSLSAATNDCRIPSTNIPTKAVDNIRRMRRQSEIVKSSSSGSVVNLTQKPTGIILGIPSNPQIKTKPISRFSYATKNAGSAADSESFGSQGPSTPYPIRQSYLPVEGRVHTDSTVAASVGTFSTSPIHGDSRNTNDYVPTEHISGFVMSSASTRPSVLVRPMNQLFSSSLGLPLTTDTFGTTPDGVCVAPNTPPRRYSGLNSRISQRSQSWQMACEHLQPSRFAYSGQHQIGSGYTAANVSDSFPANPVHVCALFPPSNLDLVQDTGTLGSTNAPTDSDLRSQRKQIPFQSVSTHTTSSRLYGAQPRHTSCGLAWPIGRSQPPQPAPSPFVQPIALPGPQYTQCALEQYLSDLLADQQVTFAGSADGSTVVHCDVDGMSASHLLTLRDQLEPLRFLQCRIENALRGVREEDMHKSQSVTSGFTIQPTREPISRLDSRSGNSVITSASMQCACRDSGVDCSSSSNNDCVISGEQFGSVFHHYAPSDQKSMLEQFSEDELRYLLKAVQDLIILRTHTSLRSRPSTAFSTTSLSSGNTPKPRVQQNAFGSRNSSRSNSSVRTAGLSAITADISGTFEDRGTLDEITAHSATDADSSAAHLMHKRLPLGFQYFKRYLDSKFGPDHHNHNSHSHRCHPLVSHSSDPVAVRANVPDATAVTVSSHIGIGTPSCDTEQSRDAQRPQLNVDQNIAYMIAHTQSSEVMRSPNDNEGHCANSKRVSLCRSFETHGPSYPRCTGAEHVDLAHGSFQPHSTPADSFTMSSQPGTDSIIDSSIWGSPVPAMDVCRSMGSDSTASHLQPSQGRQFDGSSQCFQHMGYSPFHQRSYCSTPEVSDTCGPAYARWPSHSSQQCYWWPHSPIDHGTHHLPTGRYTHQRIGPTPTGAYEYCACGLDGQQGTHSCWHMGSPTQFCHPELTHFSSDVCSGQCQPGNSPQCTIGGLLPRTHTPIDDSSYGLCPSAEGSHLSPTWCGCSMCGGRTSGVPLICRGLPRTHPLPTSPTYDWALWGSAAWNSRLPCYHSGLISPHPIRMPRSGSAGAGFNYALVDNSAAAVTNAVGLTNVTPPGMLGPGGHQHTSRDHGVGTERNVFSPQHQHLHHHPQQQPMLRSAYQCFQLRSPGASVATPVDVSGDIPTGVRSMSNSLSANDLAGYRAKLSKDIRSSKSSFELAPDLPCEPNLSLTDCSDFYSKMAAFIELDNSLQLSVPSGWCERRSSLGRSYYACDQMKQASWHHPTFGLLVPLGWERVDSCQNGVYYQHLLIPHCQRHHPNLWMPGPLKDPAMEHDNFFSDLRYLQSSMRHSVTGHCAELENYKHTSSSAEERAFLHSFHLLDVEKMVEVTRALDQLFYKELHSFVVFFERERLKIVSIMFSLDHCETIFSTSDDT